MEIVNSALAVLTQHYMIILGVLVFVAKIVSTEKKVPVISAIQKVLDKVASIAPKIGELAAKGSQLLSDLLKSDGIMGKK